MRVQFSLCVHKHSPLLLFLLRVCTVEEREIRPSCALQYRHSLNEYNLTLFKNNNFNHRFTLLFLGFCPLSNNIIDSFEVLYILCLYW